ncbi:hypothetical protein, partial [Bifidobacterium sp. A11]|uniref:hypothetical protein n=1 Tax=Bifidobacterium sp. A11 TaxID=1394176 RepID=UPI001C11C317
WWWSCLLLAVCGGHLPPDNLHQARAERRERPPVWTGTRQAGGPHGMLFGHAGRRPGEDRDARGP